MWLRDLNVILLIVLTLDLHHCVADSQCFEVSAEDICNGDIAKDLPYLYSRGPDRRYSNQTSHWRYCDVYALDKYQWYKAETAMTTVCPDMHMCGTKFPIWLTDSNPEQNDGIVNRTACLRDFDNCCLSTYSLHAINCGQFLAYCLQALPSGCHQRYCFDVPKQELTTQHSNDISTNVDSEPRSTSGRTPTKDFNTNITEDDMKGNNATLIVLISCLGIMTLVIILLVFVIVIQKKKQKIHDCQSKASAAYRVETLHVPAISSKTQLDMLHGYAKLNYDNGVDLRGHTYSSIKPSFDKLYDTCQ